MPSLCLLKYLQPQTFVASTSTGRLFRLTLTTSGGRYHLTSRLFSRMQSSVSLSRFLPSLWSSPTSQAEGGNIAAIALGAKTNLGTDIWALVESRVQKWNVAAEGFEELTLQEDISVVLRNTIQDTLHAPSTLTYLDLELLDLAVDRLVSPHYQRFRPLNSSTSSGKLLVLTSHGDTGEYVDMNYSSTPRRIYNVAQISMSSGSLRVDQLIGVPYQSVSHSPGNHFHLVT